MHMQNMHRGVIQLQMAAKLGPLISVFNERFEFFFCQVSVFHDHLHKCLTGLTTSRELSPGLPKDHRVDHNVAGELTLLFCSYGQ